MLDRGALIERWKAISSRRPAVPVAIAFVIGITLERAMTVAPLLWLGIAAVIVCAAIGLRKRGWSSALLLIAVTLTGLVSAELETHYFSAGEVALFTTDAPRLAQLELRITAPPRLLTEAVLARPLPPRQVCRAAVERIRTNGGWQEASGDVSLTIDQPHPQLAIGQTIAATGMLQRPMPASNPGQTNWAEFYRTERILATFTVPHADAVRIVSKPGWMPLERLRSKVRNLLAEGFKADRLGDFALLQALTLGDRDAAMRNAQDDFAHSGTAHLLAVSGLHIVLVGAAALLFFGRLLGLRPRAATVAAMIVVLFYALAVVPGTPAVRATVLCIAYGVNRLARRRPDGMQLLALSALGILVWHPHDLFSAGFQLSFVAVAGIIIAGQRVSRIIHALVEDEHARVARSFRPLGAAGAFLLHCRSWVIEATAMSLVAWAVLLPLVMIHFGQTNPWAIATGLLALPLVIAGLMGGVAKIVLTLLLPSFSGAWANVGWVPIATLRHCVHWLARWPGANLQMPATAAWQVGLFYGLLALPLLPWTWRWWRRSMRFAPVAGCLVAILPALIGATPTPAGDGIRITLLAIGAGQIGVIELPNGHAVLIDDGSDSVPDPLRQCLGPYLRSRAIRAIDAIILSHPDYDHISAAADTADAFRVGRVIVSPVFRGQSQGSEPAVAMLERLDAARIPVEITAQGRHIPLSDDVAIDTLWPPAGRRFTTTNNAGLVLRVTFGGRSVLFPADIQAPTERELLKSPAALGSDVLIAPHHGSSEATTAEFLAAVHPLDVVSSNDRRLSKKQRDFDAMTVAYPVYRTSRSGAVTVCIAKSGEIRIETFLNPARKKN